MTKRIKWVGLILFLLFESSFAQTWEHEPNNHCTDPNIIDITHNGTYHGTIVKGNDDYWIIRGKDWDLKSSVPYSYNININLSVESEDIIDPVVFEVFYSIAGHCDIVMHDVGYGNTELDFNEELHVFTTYYVKVSVEDQVPRRYTLSIVGDNLKVIFSGGSGTAKHPFEITTPSDLDSVRYFPNSHFIQKNDIDLNIAQFNSGAGWNPIGGVNNEFTGTYNGQGHVISNLYINKPHTDYIGLFGATKKGEIKNLGLENVNVTGDLTIGALVGRNQSNISECYSTGTVNAIHNAGGLVGRNVSEENSTAEISDSYSLVTVNASGNYSGGLVGVFSSGIIRNCYAAGIMNGTNGDGGLLGYNNGTVTRSFWDVDRSGLTWSAGGTGISTKEMKASETFISAGWNSNIWGFDRRDVNSGYPHFYWQADVENISQHDGNSNKSVNEQLTADSEDEIKYEFALEQNYPNPFNPATTIKFTIPNVETPYMSSLQQTSLVVYDILGRKVATLVNEEKEPGVYEVEWNASDMASGVYYYALTTGSFNQTKKLMLLK